MSSRAVVVAHRQTMVAEGIAAGLRQFVGIFPVAVATTAAEIEERAQRADALALDENIPGADGTARRLRRRGIRVILLGEETEAGIDDLNVGVRVSTGAPIAALASALVPGVEPVGGRSARLTQRERQVLALAAQGFAGKEVARRLGISPKTVEQHKTKIFAKLGVPNQTAAVFVTASHGRLSHDGWGRRES